MVDEVDLGEDVDARKLEVAHCAQGEKEDGDVFCDVRNVLRVAEMDYCEL